jgi:hypothetical protein
MSPTRAIRARFQAGRGGCVAQSRQWSSRLTQGASSSVIDEGMLPGGIAAPLAVGHGGHGADAQFGQAPYGTPFVAGAQDGQAAGQQVLEDLAPADAVMDLDEIGPVGDFAAQGAAAFQLSEHGAAQFLHGGEGIPVPPEGVERGGQEELHGAVARMMSAARSCRL